ncbi:MAG TPA: MMPL family transporter [Streptosporangiaceae bacterium]
MSIYLFRLARWCMGHRRIVLACWLLIAIGAISASALSKGSFNDTFTVPGVEAQQAADLLKEKIPILSGGQTQVVYAAPGGQTVTTPRAKQAIEQAIAKLEHLPQKTLVTDPFKAGTISPNKKVALATVQFAVQPGQVTDATLNDMQTANNPAVHDGLQVAYSGSVYPGWVFKISEIPELIGLVIAFVILLITFGALVAALLPIVTAVIGIVITLTTVTALASVTNIASVSTTVALMLGLSCGIDYGLFILLRYRNNLLAGMDPPDACAQAVGTAGSSVVFAALTVIIGLCGLAVANIPFLTVMGLCAAGAVLVALLVAVTLGPALMGFAGIKLISFISSRSRRTAGIAANEPDHTRGSRWGRFIVRRRIPVLITGVLVLLILAIPVKSMKLGLPSAASNPTSNTSRIAYDLITDNFGPGANGPLLIVADPVKDPAVVKTLSAALAKESDVTSVSAAAVQDGVAVIKVVPSSGPTAQATTDLVHRIRDDRDKIEQNTGATILVGGTTASNIDVSAKLGSALPVFLLVIVGLAIVLLTFAFRTVLVPVKSVIGFLLSIAAAFGVQVAMFQWGWGQHLFGITPSDTISFLPIIMIGIIFGLSSDYEIFVVSRIKEDYTQTGEAREAVARGLGKAARVVTAAALIMFSIFIAFMISSNPSTIAIAFSFAVGVLLDAFVVRLTLVPAVMAIVKDKLWYHPKWFGRYVPDPDIEGEELAEHLPG